MKMAKVFEDYFSEIQADMVSVCLEYVEKKADNIFIHCSYEQGVSACNVFYQINGKIVKRSKLNDALTDKQKTSFQYDTSDERQIKLVHIINDNISQIDKLCKENNHPTPTEMKIKYNVAKNSMKADYCYDLLYTNNPDKRVSTIFKAWFEEMSGEK
jgi:hypothetical protein